MSLTLLNGIGVIGHILSEEKIVILSFKLISNEN